MECGRQGPTYGGLCRTCYAERHPLITPPERMDLLQCVHCGKVKTARGWESLPLEEAFDGAVAEASRLTEAVSRARFTHKTHHEDERNVLLSVRATLRVEDFDVVRDFETRLRIQGATCPTCSRQRGSYFEAILQLRSTVGSVGEELAEAISRTVEDAVSGAPGAFVTKVEKVRGGYDYYLSSGALAKAIAKTLRAEYGAETKASPKVYGQREGKELYRVSYLVRVPERGRRATGGRAHSQRTR